MAAVGWIVWVAGCLVGLLFLAGAWDRRGIVRWTYRLCFLAVAAALLTSWLEPAVSKLHLLWFVPVFFFVARALVVAVFFNRVSGQGRAIVEELLAELQPTIEERQASGLDATSYELRGEPLTENEVAIEDHPWFRDHLEWLQDENPYLLKHFLAEGGAERLLAHTRSRTANALTAVCRLERTSAHEPWEIEELVHRDVIAPTVSRMEPVDEDEPDTPLTADETDVVQELLSDLQKEDDEPGGIPRTYLRIRVN